MVFGDSVAKDGPGGHRRGDGMSVPEPAGPPADPALGLTPPPPGYGPGPWSAPPRLDAPNAITALVLGILGLTVLPVVLSIPAIVIGGQAKRVAAAEPWRYSPDSAKIAVVLGWVGLGFGLLVGLLIAVAFIVPLLFLGVGLATF